jgi:hypothetical protein
MAVQQDYARLACFVDGSLVEQITSISITTNSGNQRVDLLNEGLGGFTPGSGDVTIELGFVVPIGGTEEEYQEKCARRDFVVMQVPIGRKDYVGKGKIETVAISQSVNAAVEGTLTWIGELAPLE